MIDHSDSTNGKSPKHFQDKLKADPDACQECIETQKLLNETWDTLTEMKEGYEKAIELSGQNCLELQQENVELRAENRKLREEVSRLKGTN
jgi:hypothetical protein